MPFCRFYEWGRGSGNFTLIGIQIVSVVFVFGWTTVIFTPFCLVLKHFDWLRIDALEEEVGADISRHKGPAYSNDAVKSEAILELHESRRNLADASTSSRSSRRTFNRAPGCAAIPEYTTKIPESLSMDIEIPEKD